MVLSALAAEYPAPAKVWHDEPPPNLTLLIILGDGVTIYGRHPSDRVVKLHKLNAPSWHSQARCFSAGADVFFGDEVNDSRPFMRPKLLERARAICRGCPVAHTCLEWALVNDERYGVWAGASGRNRDLMQQQIRGGARITDVVEKWLAIL